MARAFINRMPRTKLNFPIVVFTYPCSPSFLVEPEVKSIHSIGNCKALHPLIGVISSLDSYLNDNRSVSKVNLEPLTPVVVTCYPWTVSWAAAHGIQSALVGGIMSIVDRGCSERHIRQATVFWAQWNITTLWKIKKFNCWIITTKKTIWSENILLVLQTKVIPKLRLQSV